MSEKQATISTSKEFQKDLLALVGGVCSFICFIPLSSIYYGWGLSVLWGWFMVPYLHLPALTPAQAAGVSLVIGAVTSRSDLKGTREGWKLFGHALMKVPVYLFCGWLIKLAFGV
jgi:hypothetical protein